jgi:hypothetical protein
VSEEEHGVKTVKSLVCLEQVVVIPDKSIGELALKAHSFFPFVTIVEPFLLHGTVVDLDLHLRNF